MKRTALLALTGIVALSACGGGGSNAGLPAYSAPRSAATVSMAPYQIPVVTDPGVQAAERAFKATLRDPKTSYGGVPTVALIIDAPMFGPGAQVNIAVTGVNAIAGGSSYPIVSYASPVLVNVLNYQTSALQLGSSTLPAIAYDGVQYVVDPSQSSVVVNGVRYPVKFGTFANRTFTPSTASLATLYFATPADGTLGQPITFVMDFTASHWVKLRNGIAEIGMSGKATTQSRSAAIAGKVVNAAGLPVSGATVAAYAADSTRVRTALSAADGTFELHAIDGGTYSVRVYNTFAPDDADDVLVATGNDPGDSIPALTVNVPAGFRVDLGQIKD